MANKYSIDFGFDMGEAKLGGIANMQWGMAVSTDGGSTWRHHDQRKPIDLNSEVTVSIFNISDSQGQLNAVVDGGTVSSLKAADGKPEQSATTPWAVTPRVTGGRPSGNGRSVGLDLDDVPGMQACVFEAVNSGHFAVTLEITVDGHDYTFREDPELVVGGAGSGN